MRRLIVKCLNRWRLLSHLIWFQLDLTGRIRKFVLNHTNFPFKTRILVIFHFCFILLLTAEGSIQACKSPQYVELGKRATISCDFDKSFYGVFWFNTTNITSQERPFMIITESVKSGRGYSTGEFDINDIGSLIINKVSLQHDTSFAVNVLYTSDGDPNVENVRVIVFVIPENPYPVLDTCDGNGFCYQSTNTEYTINCSVRNSRPPPRLNLLLQTSEGDVSLPSNKTTLLEGILYTTIIQTTVRFNETNRLLLISCQGSITPHVEKETTILIENKQSEPSRVKERLNAHIGSEVTLSCGDDTTSYFVWRKKGQQRPIAVGMGSPHGNATNVYNNEFRLAGHNNNLIFVSIGREDNGTYICVCGNGTTSTTTVFEVAVDDSARSSSWLTSYFILFLILLLILMIMIAAVTYKVVKVRKEKKAEGTHSKASKKEVMPMLPKNPTVEDIENFLSSHSLVFGWNESRKEDCREDHDRMIKWLSQASDKKIDVQYVKLKNCFESVTDTAEYVLLVSGERLPVIKSLTMLVIHQDKEIQLGLQALEQILRYARKCDHLENLMFDGFFMPYLSKECGSVLNIIKKSKLKVEWVSGTTMGILHIDNDQCCWKENTSKQIVHKSRFEESMKNRGHNSSAMEL